MAKNYKMGLKPKSRRKVSAGLTLFIGVTFAYFSWLVWQKLTEWIGNSTLVLIITGAIVLLGIILGFISIDKIIDKFS